MTKVLKKGDEEQGGGRVGDNSILTFLCYWLDKKNATLRTAFWAIFSIRIFNS